jgi:biotin synthase
LFVWQLSGQRNDFSDKYKLFHKDNMKREGWQGMQELAESIINGYRIKRNDDTSCFLTGDLETLCKGADRIREHFHSNKVDLCAIINGRSGRCSEDCKFCAQSLRHSTGISEYGFLDEDTIIADCKAHETEGVHRYSIVTAGKALTGADFEKALSAYRRMKQECNIDLCASHGLLEKDAYIALKEAGITRYHENIETSRRYFPHICTTHTYEDKIRGIQLASEAGLFVCSGGIIGMGETWEDRIDMAVSLSELNVKSIPINALMPIKGTPFEEVPCLEEADILRTIALFRFINPEADIRLAAGRSLMTNSGEKAFHSGANATITGNMLTTSGNNINQDIHMLKTLGFDISR